MASIPIFQRSLPPGWVYSCTVGDLMQRLNELPAGDLEGLHAVGLAPSTRKRNSTDAHYLPYPRPTIHIFSHDESLQFKQPAHVRRHEIKQAMPV